MLAQPTSAGACIMVVDDTPDVLQTIERMLRALRYRVSGWLDGEQALRAAAATPPDMVLLDVDMPGLDGIEVCARLKADERLASIPVIFFSGRDDTTAKVLALRTGAVDYVTKPFQIEEVQARVETHLRLRQLQRALEVQNVVLERIVAARTRDLEQAYERLKSVDRLRGDFLDMISHEMRTPFNSIMGVAPMLFELCPVSTERDELWSLYQQSSTRLLRLLEDADLLTRLEQPAGKPEAWSVPLGEIWREAVEVSPPVAPAPPFPGEFATLRVQGQPLLLIRACMTAIRLAACFRTVPTPVGVTGRLDADKAYLEFPLDNLTLPPEAMGRFFDLTASTRACSPAEPLGMAPVLAHRIVTHFGGAMRLVSIGAPRGFLQVALACEASPSDAADDGQTQLPLA